MANQLFLDWQWACQIICNPNLLRDPYDNIHILIQRMHTAGVAKEFNDFDYPIYGTTYRGKYTKVEVEHE